VRQVPQSWKRVYDGGSSTRSQSGDEVSPGLALEALRSYQVSREAEEDWEVRELREVRGRRRGEGRERVAGEGLPHGLRRRRRVQS